MALAQNFMDVDTIISYMVIESGGNAMHGGIACLLYYDNCNRCVIPLFYL